MICRPFVSVSAQSFSVEILLVVSNEDDWAVCGWIETGVCRIGLLANFGIHKTTGQNYPFNTAGGAGSSEARLPFARSERAGG